MAGAHDQSLGNAEECGCSDPLRLREFQPREALPLIQVPTLVLHNQNLFIPIAMGRYLAERIDGAKFVEFLGADFFLATSEGLGDGRDR